MGKERGTFTSSVIIGMDMYRTFVKFGQSCIYGYHNRYRVVSFFSTEEIFSRTNAVWEGEQRKVAL